MVQETSHLAGQFILAMPGIGDSRFDHSVIAICAHDDGGAFGLCLHAGMGDLTVPALMRQLDIDPGNTPEMPVLAGGPVERERGFILHSSDYNGQDTRHVANRWAITGTRDILEDIAAGRGPKHWVAALGYAGWEGGQLEAELAVNGWFTTAATSALLWETAPADRWRVGFAASGINVGMLSTAAGRA